MCSAAPTAAKRSLSPGRRAPQSRVRPTGSEAVQRRPDLARACARVHRSERTDGLRGRAERRRDLLLAPGAIERADAAQPARVERTSGARASTSRPSASWVRRIRVQAGSREPAVPAAGADGGVGRGLTADAASGPGTSPARTIELGELEEAERFNNEAKRFKTRAGPTDIVNNTLRAADIAAAASSSTKRPDCSRKRGERQGRSQRAVVRARGAGPAWRSPPETPTEATRHLEAALETVEKTRSDLIGTGLQAVLSHPVDRLLSRVCRCVGRSGPDRTRTRSGGSSRGRVLAERHGVATPAEAERRTFAGGQ